jgi:hypothetical protein
MSSGFNSDIQVGAEVFHVQTEDRGPLHPFIDTAVYHRGRVVHHRSAGYEDWVVSADFTPEKLQNRVSEQHRAVIEALRSGALDTEIARATEQEAEASGIEAELVNPGSWLSGGQISLEIEIRRRSDRKPVSGAHVEATIEGALEESRHSGASDEHGRARIQFPLPPLSKGDLALVIHAHAEHGTAEIRFTMRSRAKTPPQPPRHDHHD